MADAKQIRVRRDTLANWQTANPVLADGELAWVTDTRDMVAGPGDFNSLWNDAQSIANRAIGAASSATSSATAAASSAASAGSAASAAVAPLSTAQRRGGFVVIGDSITAYNSTVGNAWHKALATVAGKIRHRGFFATGGYTLEQIETTHLPSVLAMDPLPGACIIAGGTNNIGATGSTGAYDPVAARATLLRMVSKLQAVGVMPVLWCPPPRNDSTTVNASTQRWNAWVKSTAQRLGLPYVDAYNAVVDPATGLYKSGYNLDSVHPNALGHYLIGKRAATDPEFLRRFNNDTPHLSTDVLDAANLIPAGRGLFNQGVNGANVPAGWAAYGGNGTAYTLSQAAATDPAVGNWQILTQTAGSAANSGGLQWNATTNFAAGDRVAVATRVRSACPDDGTMGNATLKLEARQGGTSLLSTVEGGFGGTYDGIFWQEFTVPAGTDTLRQSLIFTTSVSPTIDVSVRFAQSTIVNLTALAAG
ncbi:GDSL-type esterase/lipase family protein [Curtobacterium sp. Csp2]|uniref:GDSL-type esterase/lipase family protein n=1 Tax=Curtobacterium sp. Csp2 TaxID=2495430 RepID=UPI001C2EBF8C|nr:GDSL-type esterase/lipase family protein [Curtobacterium sp. Csp2]